MKSLKFSGKLKRRSPLLIRRVVGHSMAPVLREGHIIFARTSYRDVRSQDIVVIFHDGKEKIKRVSKVKGTQIFVVGDNLAASTDSRDFGWIDRDCITAKVVWPLIKKS